VSLSPAAASAAAVAEVKEEPQRDVADPGPGSGSGWEWKASDRDPEVAAESDHDTVPEIPPKFQHPMTRFVSRVIRLGEFSPIG
jgi:hypothetical protein